MMPELKNHPYFLTPRSPNPDYPLFIYLPGMDGTGQLLRSQIPSLAAAFDVRCLVIPPHYLSDWQDLANQVTRLIATELSQRNSKRVYLCGESFGGCLALKVALTAPHLLNRIILCNPATSVSQLIIPQSDDSQKSPRPFRGDALITCQNDALAGIHAEEFSNFSRTTRTIDPTHLYPCQRFRSLVVFSLRSQVLSPLSAKRYDVGVAEVRSCLFTGN